MEMELAWVSDESSREFKLVPKDLLTEAEAAAKAAMADSDMCAPSPLRVSSPCSRTHPCLMAPRASQPSPHHIQVSEILLVASHVPVSVGTSRLALVFQ